MKRVPSRWKTSKVFEIIKLYLSSSSSVTAVAVRYISTGLLEKMKRSTAATFDEFYRYITLYEVYKDSRQFYRTDAMNLFLWSVLLYYNAFTTHKEASSDENIEVPG